MAGFHSDGNIYTFVIALKFCNAKMTNIYMWLDLRKPSSVEYFIFRELPLLNIQATLAR